MSALANYDDNIGWVQVADVVPVQAAARIATACDDLAERLSGVRTGDKPHGLTRRLTALDGRLPETNAIAQALGPVVDQILPGGWTVGLPQVEFLPCEAFDKHGLRRVV